MSPGPDDPFSIPPDGPSGRRVQLTLQTNDTDPPTVGYLDAQLERLLDELQIDEAAISLLVVDDARMAEAHQQYMDIAGTTDVLTFDLRESPGDALLEADIMLCADEAARQAKGQGHAVRDELLLYALHGVMHLLGEDDHTDAGYRRMHERENTLLDAIGIGRLFGAIDHENNPTHPDAEPD